MYTAAQVMERAAFFLNDREQDNFTNEVLLPVLQIAMDDLRSQLLESNYALTNQTSTDFTITTAMRDIGGPTGPALPLDLINPIDLYEKDPDSDVTYMRMTRVDFLPKGVVLTSYLTWYCWIGQYITFVGANATREVKMDYVADRLGQVVTDQSVIKLIDGKSFLAYRTAALAAEFYGENETRAAALNANAQSEIEILLNNDAKNRQSIVTRRRPFRSSYKGNYRVY